MMTRTKSKKSAVCKRIVFIAVFIAAIFVFSTKISAQNDVQTLKDRNENVIRGKGVSQEVLNEYQEVVSKYLERYSLGNPNENEKFYWNSEYLSEEDWSRLYVIYFQMTANQKEEQQIKFYGSPMSKSNRTPSARIYGLFVEDDSSKIWIDGEFVEKSTLSSYKITDFVNYHTSSLLRNGNKNEYRVDLWTKKGYKKFSKQFAKPVSTDKLLEREPEIIFVMERDGEKYITLSKKPPIWGWHLTSIDEINKTKTWRGTTKTTVKSTMTPFAPSPLSYHQKIE